MILVGPAGQGLRTRAGWTARRRAGPATGRRRRDRRAAARPARSRTPPAAGSSAAPGRAAGRVPRGAAAAVRRWRVRRGRGPSWGRRRPGCARRSSVRPCGVPRSWLAGAPGSPGLRQRICDGFGQEADLGHGAVALGGGQFQIGARRDAGTRPVRSRPGPRGRRCRSRTIPARRGSAAASASSRSPAA